MMATCSIAAAMSLRFCRRLLVRCRMTASDLMIALLPPSIATNPVWPALPSRGAHASLARILCAQKSGTSVDRGLRAILSVLLAIPHEITRFHEVTVDPKGRQSPLKQRLLRFWIR
jgi:hypothetical protein